MDALDYDCDIKEVPRLRRPRHRWGADRLRNPQLTVSFLPFVTNMPHTKELAESRNFRPRREVLMTHAETTQIAVILTLTIVEGKNTHFARRPQLRRDDEIAESDHLSYPNVRTALTPCQPQLPRLRLHRPQTIPHMLLHAQPQQLRSVMSARFTARANAVSFIFFLTPATSTS